MSLVICAMMFGCSLMSSDTQTPLEQKMYDVQFFTKQAVRIGIYHTDYTDNDWSQVRYLLTQAKNLLVQPDEVDLSRLGEFLQSVPDEYGPIFFMVFDIIEKHVHMMRPLPEDNEVASLAVAAFDGAIEAIDEHLND